MYVFSYDSIMTAYTELYDARLELGSRAFIGGPRVPQPLYKNRYDAHIIRVEVSCYSRPIIIIIIIIVQ